jgi:hypothetical protein
MVAEHEGGSSSVVEIVVVSSTAASWASEIPAKTKISARSEAKHESEAFS